MLNSSQKCVFFFFVLFSLVSPPEINHHFLSGQEVMGNLSSWDPHCISRRKG